MLYFGVLIGTMFYGALNPDVVTEFEKSVEEAFSQSDYVEKGREAIKNKNLIL